VELRPEDDLELEVALAYEEFATGLLRYALVTIRNREAAQDAVQEVFLRYFVSRSRGQIIQTRKAWLYRVLRNYLLDCLKSSSVTRETGMETVHLIVDEQQNPEVECLRLRNEGFGYEEIADILVVSSGTVAALLSRGQKKIRKALDQPVTAVSARWAESPC
jgi:DNA-directed RNA polymerase specialized sigma24 family protein